MAESVPSQTSPTVTAALAGPEESSSGHEQLQPMNSLPSPVSETYESLESELSPDSVHHHPGMNHTGKISKPSGSSPGGHPPNFNSGTEGRQQPPPHPLHPLPGPPFPQFYSQQQPTGFTNSRDFVPPHNAVQYGDHTAVINSGMGANVALRYVPSSGLTHSTSGSPASFQQRHHPHMVMQAAPAQSTSPYSGFSPAPSPPFVYPTRSYGGSPLYPFPVVYSHPSFRSPTQEMELKNFSWYPPLSFDPSAGSPSYGATYPTSSYGSSSDIPHSSLTQYFPAQYRPQLQSQPVGLGISGSPNLGASPAQRSPPAQGNHTFSSGGTTPPQRRLDTDGTAPPNSTRDARGGKNRTTSRRSYHPNPPVGRSDWVMWVGNVPSDATKHEFEEFFVSHFRNDQSTRTSARSSSNMPPVSEPGVLSVFIISRSSCAFVNFESELHLQYAIKTFNGKPLRPSDPRCLPLVCRVRHTEDYLKAGVGGQRGLGMHQNWVQNRATSPSAETDHGSSSSKLGGSSPSSIGEKRDVGAGRRPDLKRGAPRSSTTSCGSSSSSFLAEHFPTRYFIMKSLSQYDVDLSVRNGLWATQTHNESILDKAFRSSEEVYLIFGVNKSGEFFGYAKMTGPICQGERPVLWASRTPSSSSSGAPMSPSAHPLSPHGTEARPEDVDASVEPVFLSPSSGDLQALAQSPDVFPAAPSQTQLENPTHPSVQPGSSHSAPSVAREIASAPANIDAGRQESILSNGALHPGAHSLDPVILSRMNGGSSKRDSNGAHVFELDSTAPIRAMKKSPPSSRDDAILGGASSQPLHEGFETDPHSSPNKHSDEDLENDLRLDPTSAEEQAGGSTVKNSPQPDPAHDSKEEPPSVPNGSTPTWGDPFRVQWIKTTRLPFFRTKHLKNPWNHDREVKVSRDGTEIEPRIGQMLLEEWDKYEKEVEAAAGERRDSQTIDPSESSSPQREYPLAKVVAMKLEGVADGPLASDTRSDWEVEGGHRHRNTVTGSIDDKVSYLKSRAPQPSMTSSTSAPTTV